MLMLFFRTPASAAKLTFEATWKISDFRLSFFKKMDAAFLLTIGRFLLTILAFLLTVDNFSFFTYSWGFLLTILAFLLTVGALLLTMRKCV